MMGRFLTIAFFAFVGLQPIVALGGTSQFITISGVVWGFDDVQVKLRDSHGMMWVIPRKLLKKNTELRPDQKIAVKVREADVRKYKAAE